MPLEREIETLAHRRRDPLERARRLAMLVFKRRTLRAYRALFLTEAGTIKPEAVLVLADLSQAAGLGKVLGEASGDYRAFRDGKRGLLLHLLDRLDPDKLADLARSMRELNHDRIDTDA